MSANQKGAPAEAEITAAATRLGVSVLRPVAEHGRYDLAFELSQRIHRVQCKWGSYDSSAGLVKGLAPDKPANIRRVPAFSVRRG